MCASLCIHVSLCVSGLLQHQQYRHTHTERETFKERSSSDGRLIFQIIFVQLNRECVAGVCACLFACPPLSLPCCHCAHAKTTKAEFNSASLDVSVNWWTHCSAHISRFGSPIGSSRPQPRTWMDIV